MLDALTPTRRGFVVGAGLVAAVVAIVVLTVAVTHRGPTVTPERTDALPPVLLVPGYGGATARLGVLADALREDGRFVRIIDLGMASIGDLRDQAGLVDRAVGDLRNDTGSSSVDVVAFSAGGIATRLWVVDHGGASIARRIITLGSPHHGTEIAGVGGELAPKNCESACRELTPDSELIKKLDSGDETPAGPDWVSIWTEHDELVVPTTSSELAGALSFSVQSVCPDDVVEHQGLPSDPAVIAMVRHELGRAAPSTPDTSVCRASAVSPS